MSEYIPSDSEENPFEKRQRRKAVPLQVDRLLPHSIEAEQGVLGCMILSPVDSVNYCAGRVGERDLYDLRHQALFGVIAGMVRDGIKVDLITLQNRLRDNNQLEAVGGLAYISALQDTVPSAAVLPEYVTIVTEKAALREVIQSSTQAIELAHESENVDGLIAIWERKLESVRTLRRRTEETQFTAIKDVHHPFVDWAQGRHKNKGKLCGITSGLRGLDRITDGFQAGELCVIGARPGIGKSAIGLEIIRAACVEAEEQAACMFLSLEMSKISLYRRMVASISGVSLKKMKEGDLTPANFVAMNAACARISKSPFYIKEAMQGLSASKAAGVIRQSVREHGTRLVVLDYIQKLRADEKHEKRNYEVAATSNTLLSVARETGVALICLAQVNRESERDKDSVPRLGHLADSSGLEKDADLVILLHRDRLKNTGPADLIVAKQRDGECGVCHTTFRGEICRFDPAAPEREQESKQTTLPVEEHEPRWPD